MSIGSLLQFVMYSGIAAVTFASLSEVWGEFQRAAAAAERLIELLYSEDNIFDPIYKTFWANKNIIFFIIHASKENFSWIIFFNKAIS